MNQRIDYLGAGRSGAGTPGAWPVLVAVQLDGDLVARPVSAASQLAGLTEKPEQRAPRFPVRLLGSERAETPGQHRLHKAGVRVCVVPPVARPAVPGGCLGFMGPHDPAGMDALSGADGRVGRFRGRLERSVARLQLRNSRSRTGHRQRGHAGMQDPPSCELPALRPIGVHDPPPSPLFDPVNASVYRNAQSGYSGIINIWRCECPTRDAAFCVPPRPGLV
jgi:hypothetical protein